MQTKDFSFQKHPLKGILLCLLGYFFMSLIGVFEKPIANSVNLTVILFFQSIICFLLILPASLKNYRQLLTIQMPGVYVVRIISGFICYALVFYLIRFMPMSEAYLYQYSGSLWVPLIMALWLNVRVPKYSWLGIIIGFIGIILMLKPGADMFGMIAILGVICGILQGVSVVAIGRLSVSEPLTKILFYYFLVCVIVTGVLLINHWQPLTWKDLILLSGIGVSTYIAQQFITASLHYAHASTLAPISYVSIFFAGIFGWLFWHEMSTTTTLIGMALVFFGCLLTILLNRSSKAAIVVDDEITAVLAVEK